MRRLDCTRRVHVVKPLNLPASIEERVPPEWRGQFRRVSECRITSSVCIQLISRTCGCPCSVNSLHRSWQNLWVAVGDCRTKLWAACCSICTATGYNKKVSVPCACWFDFDVSVLVLLWKCVFLARGVHTEHAHSTSPIHVL